MALGYRQLKQGLGFEYWFVGVATPHGLAGLEVVTPGCQADVVVLV